MKFTHSAAMIGSGLVIALASAGTAHAVDAYMDGVLNVGPGWSTITGPNGEKCGTGCTEIKYDYITQSSATRAAGKWMDANNNPDAVLHVYSLGSVGAIRARALRPDWQGTIVAYGSPSKPNNGATTSQGGSPVLQVGGGRTTFVSVQGDSVAFRTGSLKTHTDGYRNRNFQTEKPVSSTPVAPNVTDNVYAPPPAPSTVKPKFNLFDMRTWFTPKAPAPIVEPVSARIATESEPEAQEVSEDQEEPTRQASRKARQDRAEAISEAEESEEKAEEENEPQERQEADNDAAESGSDDSGSESSDAA